MFTAVVLSVGGPIVDRVEDIGLDDIVWSLKTYDDDSYTGCLGWLTNLADEMDALNEMTADERLILPVIIGIEEDPDPDMIPALKVMMDHPGGQALCMATSGIAGGPLSPNDFGRMAVMVGQMFL